MKRTLTITLICYCISLVSFSQDITLYQQYNGRYDYTAIGNTLNQFENNLSDFCEILPSSEADLNLGTNQTIIAAYLYWAGSGEADTNVLLNGNPIDADLSYSVSFDSSIYGELVYFSCFTDITDFVINQGNTTYELSELDISNAINNNPGYCGNRTNFAGWSIYVLYEDPNLPLNQLSLFSGFRDHQHECY